MTRRRDRGPFHTSTTIEHQIGDIWLTIELDIKFTRDPYDPGDWETPPGGGGIDSIETSISSVAFTNGTGFGVPLDVTNKNSPDFLEYLNQEYKDHIRQVIQDHEWEPEDDGDAAYDRWKDERREKR